MTTKQNPLLVQIATDLAVLVEKVNTACDKTEEHERFINGSNGTPGAKTLLNSHTSAIERLENSRKENRALWISILLLVLAQVADLVKIGFFDKAAHAVSAVVSKL